MRFLKLFPLFLLFFVSPAWATIDYQITCDDIVNPASSAYLQELFKLRTEDIKNHVSLAEFISSSRANGMPDEIQLDILTNAGLLKKRPAGTAVDIGGNMVTTPEAILVDPITMMFKLSEATYFAPVEKRPFLKQLDAIVGEYVKQNLIEKRGPFHYLETHVMKGISLDRIDRDFADILTAEGRLAGSNQISFDLLPKKDKEKTLILYQILAEYDAVTTDLSERYVTYMQDLRTSLRRFARDADDNYAAFTEDDRFHISIVTKLAIFTSIIRQNYRTILESLYPHLPSPTFKSSERVSGRLNAIRAKFNLRKLDDEIDAIFVELGMPTFDPQGYQRAIQWRL